MEPPPVRRMPPLSPSGAPTPDPAPEGGEVLAAGRARALAARSRNQPQALERIGLSDALKGTLRRALPALDRVLNAGDTAAPDCRGPRLVAVVSGLFHTKRHRPIPNQFSGYDIVTEWVILKAIQKCVNKTDQTRLRVILLCEYQQFRARAAHGMNVPPECIWVRSDAETQSILDWSRCSVQTTRMLRPVKCSLSASEFAQAISPSWGGLAVATQNDVGPDAQSR